MIDGRRFDSLKEGRRYRHLKAEQAAGRISGLRCQVPFALRVNGVRVCGYKADFVYIRGAERVVEDVKGVRTAAYKLKRRLMKAIYGIDIHEV